VAAGDRQGPEDEVEYDKKLISPITVTGGMIGSVIAMIIGSFFGTKGTLFGAALGSGASATLATVYENTARKAHARLRAVREQEHVETEIWRHPLMERLMHQDGGRDRLIRARQKRILAREKNPWKTAAVSLGVMTGCLLVAVATLFTIETATGKTLHSDLTGNKQYGTSFNYTTVAPTIAPPSSSPPSLSPVSSSPSPSAIVSADINPYASPVPSGGVPSGPTSTPSSSGSASPMQSAVIAPAANAGPSSSKTITP